VPAHSWESEAAGLRGGKVPFGVTTFRRETVADLNRGQMRGWVGLAAAAFAILAILSWPSIEYVVLSALLAVGMALVVVWIHFTMPDAELAAHRRQHPEEPAEAGTGGPD
jgi:hypothetical protein